MFNHKPKSSPQHKKNKKTFLKKRLDKPSRGRVKSFVSCWISTTYASRGGAVTQVLGYQRLTEPI